ncbi:uncharacterized protein VTP21DRAFT_4102 [Calcarisporiella thermophila]|uniref:uncharacterized protein n=1 Tax=Calcarisporiella thermophila TaxID=911321 RepID=UPI003743A68D
MADAIQLSSRVNHSWPRHSANFIKEPTHPGGYSEQYTSTLSSVARPLHRSEDIRLAPLNPLNAYQSIDSSSQTQWGSARPPTSISEVQSGLIAPSGFQTQACPHPNASLSTPPQLQQPTPSHPNPKHATLFYHLFRSSPIPPSPEPRQNKMSIFSLLNHPPRPSRDRRASKVSSASASDSNSSAAASTSSSEPALTTCRSCKLSLFQAPARRRGVSGLKDELCNRCGLRLIKSRRFCPELERCYFIPSKSEYIELMRIAASKGVDGVMCPACNAKELAVYYPSVHLAL